MQAFALWVERRYTSQPSRRQVRRTVSRFTATGMLRYWREARHGWQTIAGKGVYITTSVKEVNRFDTAGVISVRYTSTVNAFRR